MVKTDYLVAPRLSRTGLGCDNNWMDTFPSRYSIQSLVNSQIRQMGNMYTSCPMSLVFMRQLVALILRSCMSVCLSVGHQLFEFFKKGSMRISSTFFEFFKIGFVIF